MTCYTFDSLSLSKTQRILVLQLGLMWQSVLLVISTAIWCFSTSRVGLRCARGVVVDCSRLSRRSYCQLPSLNKRFI